MPQVVKEHFVKLDANKHKVAISWSGKPYWVESAKNLGLADTEDDGVRFCSDVRPSSLSESSIVVREGGTKDQQAPVKDSKLEDES